MKKYEISRKGFTTVNMYYQYGLTIEGICDLIAKQPEVSDELQESYDDQKTAREVFNEKYRPQALSRRCEGWSNRHTLIIFYDLSEADYDENGNLVSDRKLLERAAEELLPKGMTKPSFEKIGIWEGKMDLDRFKIEERYELSQERDEIMERRYPGYLKINLIKFTDRHRMDLFNRVFALYNWIDTGCEEPFYRFCWEVNPDNLTEAVNEDKTYIFYPIYEFSSWVGPDGVFYDGESLEPIDFAIYGPNSRFVVYTAEFEVPDDFTGYVSNDEMEEIFDRHPSPVIKKAGTFTVPQEAFDYRYYMIKLKHERKDGRVLLRASYIQEENEKGVRRLSFSAPSL